MTAHFETLLIVEDDAQIRNFIAYALKQEGFAYHTASAAQQAMEILISQKIDLMILDLGLPDFDGMEVIDKVRSWSELRSSSYPHAIRTRKRRPRWMPARMIT